VRVEQLFLTWGRVPQGGVKNIQGGSEALRVLQHGKCDH